MLNVNEIKMAIDELERAESSFPAYAKLAHLYTILDHNQPREETEERYSRSAAPPDSEFLRLVDQLDYDRVMAVMDDLMDTLKVVQPNVYSAVMRQIIQP